MISLHFSPKAALHGPQPCDRCGRLTGYWIAKTRTPLCLNCVDELNADEGDAADYLATVSAILAAEGRRGGDE